MTGRPRPGEPLNATFRRMADELAARESEILSLMVFGSLAAREEIDRALRAGLGEPSWPITWVEGASCDGGPLAGVQAFAIANALELERLLAANGP